MGGALRGPVGRYFLGMPNLEMPYAHHARSAMGWLDLGNPVEAQAELDQIPFNLRAHSDVLIVQWEIHGHKREWESAVKVAQALVALNPNSADAWVKQSYALHELKRTREAWQALLAIEGRFPDYSIISYNLACYACQLGDYTESMRRLRKAMEIGGRDEIKKMALQDSDLTVLWPEIKKL